MNKVKLGILGLGSHCEKSHYTHLAQNENCEIVSVFDTDVKKCEKLTNGKVKICSSEDELLDTGIDAIVIMTPDKFHIYSAYKALKSGKHVFCEKPLCDNKKQLSILEQSINEVKNQNLIFTSCHPRRYDTPFVWLKNKLSSYIEKYGDVISFDFDFSYRKPPNKILHHGLLMDHFNHEVDLMNFLFGFSDFEAFKLNDSQTKYRVAGQRKDGISFIFGGTRMLDNPIYPESCSVRFEKAILRIDTKRGIAYLDDYRTNFVCDIGETDYVNRFKSVNDNFINSILGLEESYLSLQDLQINTESGIHLHEDGSYKSEK